MDKIDLKILDCIQQDANLSASQIAEKVELSTTPCWRRIRKLEKEQVILSKVGLLNRDKLNLGLMFSLPFEPINITPLGWNHSPKQSSNFPKWLNSTE